MAVDMELLKEYNYNFSNFNTLVVEDNGSDILAPEEEIGSEIINVEVISDEEKLITKEVESILTDTYNNQEITPENIKDVISNVASKISEKVVNVYENAILEELENVNYNEAVNFSQETLEEPKVEVTSTPEVGEPKVKVTIPDNEWIMNNYVDYDSFNKIKQSNANDVIKAVRVLNYKVADPSKQPIFKNFLDKFNPNGELDKRLKYELIRHKGNDLMVRLSIALSGIKYHMDIFPDLNKVEMDHYVMKNNTKK